MTRAAPEESRSGPINYSERTYATTFHRRCDVLLQILLNATVAVACPNRVRVFTERHMPAFWGLTRQLGAVGPSPSDKRIINCCSAVFTLVDHPDDALQYPSDLRSADTAGARTWGAKSEPKD